LADLGPGTGATPTASFAGLIDEVLAGIGSAGGTAATANTSSKSGYTFVYSPAAADTNGKIDYYSFTASPVSPGTTGTNYYYTDQSGVIRQNSTAPAGSSDSPLAG
jgi:hypothetical protein